MMRGLRIVLGLMILAIAVPAYVAIIGIGGLREELADYRRRQEMR